MTNLKLLTLGVGSVWVCSWQTAQEANVGCAINCANFTMKYQPGVKAFWLHIAYHGKMDTGEGCKISWQDRVQGAMRLVLCTLHSGKDVVIHCAHGPQMAKVVCESKCLRV